MLWRVAVVSSSACREVPRASGTFPPRAASRRAAPPAPSQHAAPAPSSLQLTDMVDEADLDENILRKKKKVMSMEGIWVCESACAGRTGRSNSHLSPPSPARLASL